jgi:hypothetical protein
MVEQGRFLPMEMERHQRLAAPAAGATITMLREGRVSAMENGECSPGSQPRQLGMRGEPMFYLRVGGTMQQWRRQWKKEIGRSISLRGADA